MSATPRDAEARAIALLVDAHLNPPSEWAPEHHATAEAAAVIAAAWLARDGRAVFTLAQEAARTALEETP